MLYSGQHNGKGKQHLIPQGDDKELCRTSGVLLFTCSHDLEYKDGKWYEVFGNSSMEINDAVLSEYCKKCIKAAIQKATL
jgi:hypothetical protein